MGMGRGRISIVHAALLFAALACNGDESSGPSPSTSYGIVIVRVATTGEDLDDRYDISIGSEHRTLAALGYVTFTVTPGTVVVKIDGVAQNCVIDGQDTRTASVTKGTTLNVDFAVGCLATGLLITTHTIGTDFPDKYQFLLGGFNSRQIGVNEEVTFSHLTPGTYRASLAFPGENCAQVSTPEITAVVTNRALTPISFDVECRQPTRLEKIAFIDDSIPTVRRLFLARPDGTDLKFIGVGQSPVWSPDGSSVAYIGQICDFYYYYNLCVNRLFITDPEVGRTREVGMTQYLSVSAPAWSPADNVIAFIHTDTHSLYLISPDGGSASKLATGAAFWVNDPSWSPDGRRLAMTCMVEPNNMDICIINRDGTGFTRVTTGSQTESDPAWSPDGNTIAYVTNVAGPLEIATMAIDGTGFRKLTEGFAPSWSRGGSMIAFSRDLGTFTIKPDGTSLTKITSGRQRDIAWRP